MKIISVPIQKGGSGKTTKILNLAGALREAGKKCPQILSHSLGIHDEAECNIYHLLKQEVSRLDISLFNTSSNNARDNHILARKVLFQDR